MARSSMAGIITKVRRMIYDPSSAVFTDDLIQEECDQNRKSVSNLTLRPEPTRLPGGVLVWREHFADGLTYWETDAVLRTVGGATLTPDAGTSDFKLGYFYFGAGQIPPVIISGKVYDVYGAAVELMTEWNARNKDIFDFADGATTLGRKQAALSQRFQQYEQLIRSYGRRRWAQPAQLGRGDTNARA